MRFACLALVALAGCTTTASDLRERAPVARFQTSKPPADVAQCLAESVSRIGTPSVFQGSNETTVTFVQQAATTLFISIRTNGEGTVWRVNELIPYQAAISRCA